MENVSHYIKLCFKNFHVISSFSSLNSYLPRQEHSYIMINVYLFPHFQTSAHYLQAVIYLAVSKSTHQLGMW